MTLNVPASLAVAGSPAWTRSRLVSDNKSGTVHNVSPVFRDVETCRQVFPPSDENSTRIVAATANRLASQVTRCVLPAAQRGVSPAAAVVSNPNTTAVHAVIGLLPFFSFDHQRVSRTGRTASSSRR